MRRPCRRLLVSVAALALSAGSPRPAFCTEATDFVRGDTVCPDPKAVEAEVSKLTSLEARSAYLTGASVRVFADGNAYGVEIQQGTESYRKDYEDPAQACDQRARVVAVTIVMTLVPPDLSLEAPNAEAADETPPRADENAPAPASDAAARAPASPEPRVTESPRAAPAFSPTSEQATRSLQLEAGAWFQHSFSNSEVPRIAAWGGELLGALGTPRVAGLLGLSAGGSSEFALGEIRASMLEASARAGARALWPVNRTTFALEAAFVVARRRVSARAPNDPEAGGAFELGGSVGANVAFETWRWMAPLAGFRLNVFPVPSELEATPRGPIGTLPKFWFGAHAGLRFAL